MNKKTILWAWIDTEIRSQVETIASAKGISLSEYVRSLILDDLEKRKAFDKLFDNESSKHE